MIAACLGVMRMVQQQQTPPEPKVRIVTSSGAGGTSPIKTTMTLTQAQQLGLIPGSGTGGGSVKILPKRYNSIKNTYTRRIINLDKNCFFLQSVENGKDHC